MMTTTTAPSPAARARAERYAELARSYNLDVKVSDTEYGQVQVTARRPGDPSWSLQILVMQGRGTRTRVAAYEHTAYTRKSTMRRLLVRRIGTLMQVMGH